MQDNPNTEDLDDLTPDPLIDSDDWELAFEPLEGHAYAALRMGFNIATLRKDLDGLLIKSRPRYGSTRSRNGSAVPVHGLSQSIL
jgi:hypothetical protein